MYEWQNKSELFLPSGFSIPFCKGVGGYVSYESSIKSGAPCVIDATHARFLAKKRLPKLIFDFIDGAAGREIGKARNEQAFGDIQLQSRVLRQVDPRNLTTKFIDQSFQLPFGIAPMGMCNLSHPKADQIMGQVAKTGQIPVGLSSAASSRLEDMRKWAGTYAWFQLYVTPPLDHTLSLVRRAQNAGFSTLVFTVDVPQVSRRLRDVANGFKMPFRMRSKQFFDFATHPRWSLATLANGVPKPLNFPDNGDGFDRDASRALADWEFLKRLRELWPGKLVVKGITSVPDALQVQECGADAIYISTHGGRQLDSAPASIAVLPLIRQALGPDYPLLIDSGVRNGEDIVKALVCGANMVMLGRPVLYALAADGARGLDALFSGLAYDVSAEMAQLGARNISDLTPAMIVKNNHALLD